MYRCKFRYEEKNVQTIMRSVLLCSRFFAKVPAPTLKQNAACQINTKSPLAIPFAFSIQDAAKSFSQIINEYMRQCNQGGNKMSRQESKLG